MTGAIGGAFEGGAETMAYKSTYNTARVMAKAMSFFGWVVAIIGVVVAMAGGTVGDGSVAGTLPGLMVVLGGLAIAAAGQITRAAVDTADHTGDMVAILRERLLPPSH